MIEEGLQLQLWARALLGAQSGPEPPPPVPHTASMTQVETPPGWRARSGIIDEPHAVLCLSKSLYVAAYDALCIGCSPPPATFCRIQWWFEGLSK